MSESHTLGNFALEMEGFASISQNICYRAKKSNVKEKIGRVEVARNRLGLFVSTFAHS